jgi:hypothetical protein
MSAFTLTYRRRAVIHHSRKFSTLCSTLAKYFTVSAIHVGNCKSFRSYVLSLESWIDLQIDRPAIEEAKKLSIKMISGWVTKKSRSLTIIVLSLKSWIALQKERLAIGKAEQFSIKMVIVWVTKKSRLLTIVK